MPITDVALFVHGAGANASSPATDVANAFTAGISTTTMTVSAVATGQLQVGQVIAGSSVTLGTILTALIPTTGGIGLTGTYTVSPSQSVSGSTPMTATPDTVGDALCASGSQYSNNEIAFGYGFPTYAEKVGVVPNTNVDFGLHIVVQGEFNLLTSVLFDICTSTNPGALVGTSIASRSFTLAQLQVTDAHYFIPIDFAKVVGFTRFHATLTGTNPTVGTIIAWFGPNAAGTQ